jgi:hypothetical protein
MQQAWQGFRRGIMWSTQEVSGLAEKAIESYLNKRVKAVGGLTYKWVSPGCIGVPDRIVVLPGNRIYMVEVKQQSGRLAPIQRQVHATLARLGVQVLVFYNKEDIDSWLANLGQA